MLPADLEPRAGPFAVGTDRGHHRDGRGDLHARRQALSELNQDKFAVHKLFEEIAPRYSNRNGGYTRIVKLGPRRADSAEMVFLELV